MMVDKKISISTDGIVKYFGNLSMDLWIAYAVLAVGIVAIILGLVL